MYCILSEVHTYARASAWSSQRVPHSTKNVGEHPFLQTQDGFACHGCRFRTMRLQMMTRHVSDEDVREVVLLWPSRGPQTDHARRDIPVRLPAPVGAGNLSPPLAGADRTQRMERGNLWRRIILHYGSHLSRLPQSFHRGLFLIVYSWGICKSLVSYIPNLEPTQPSIVNIQHRRKSIYARN